MSEVYTFAEEQLSNVSHVLFGNQKQASVINAAVVKIVARGLADVSGESCLNTEQSVIETISDYLQTMCDTGVIGDHNLVMLLAGEQSLANLLEVGPKTLHVNQPNPESPKYTFRVGMLGEEPEVDNSAETLGDVFSGMGMLIKGAGTVTPVDGSGKPVFTHHASSESTTCCPYNPTDDFPTRARKIKDAILPLCPNAVKTEIPDNEYAQALCMAEYYYKNIQSEGLDTTSTVDFGDSLPVKVAADTIDAIYYMRDDGVSVDEIANKLGFTPDEIRNILSNY